jgi:hypothetical protein
MGSLLFFFLEGFWGTVFLAISGFSDQFHTTKHINLQIVAEVCLPVFV